MTESDYSIRDLIVHEPITCLSHQICCLPENITSSSALDNCNTWWSIPSFLIGLSAGLSGMVLTTCIACYFNCNSRNQHPTPAEVAELHTLRYVETELGMISIH